MIKTKIDRLALFRELKSLLCSYNSSEIEDGIMNYCLSNYGITENIYSSSNSEEIASILSDVQLPCDLDVIIEFFESLIENDNKDENGIVFTPKYIADYISHETFKNVTEYKNEISIIDPGCGGGIFLLSAIEYFNQKFNIPVDELIENNIFGMDINSDNANRCKLILKLLSAKYGGNYETIEPNIKCIDSLDTNWNSEFNRETFTFVIGNPPYVNPHDMSKDTVNFLKKNYKTTKSGVFNIFYAFIEKSMQHIDKNGTLGFIIPNNFLTIKSALDLREWLQSSKYIKSILDFADNMVFKPVRTYNCILLLSPEDKELFEYYVMEKVENIEASLEDIQFNSMHISSLDKNGWKLVDKNTRRNITKIESQGVPIKPFIRTGIATLRDGVYLVECDDNGYYKQLGDEKIYIENDLVKPIYKIPELKSANCIDDVKRHIIFPYVKKDDGYSLIDEQEFMTKYPKTYNILLAQREELDSRDKGKGVPNGWYAYGRSQGLNKYGKKLMFPTFASEPHFTFVDNEDALFCNGYAVFENEQYDLDILQKVLNSRVMDYYVANTSYSIEGGYYCYQKKYIERFSLPILTSKEIQFIRSSSKQEVDDFLWNKYELN